MAVEQPWGKIGWLLANSDLSAKQFCAVKVTSAGGFSVCGLGEASAGTLNNDPTSGQPCDVWAAGITKALYGDTVAAGDELMSDASGHYVPRTGTYAVLAIALAAGNAGELHEVLLSKTSGAGSGPTTSMISIPIKLSKLTNADVVTNLTPGFAGTILKAQFFVTDPATTAAKAASLNLEIGNPGTNVTGGVVALTSANCTPLGNVVAGSAITANNAFTDTDVISVEASGVTAFVEGEGVLVITLKAA